MKKLTLLLLAITLLAFTVGNRKSDYQAPSRARNLFTADFDKDGDNDIFTGNSFNNQTQWGGG